LLHLNFVLVFTCLRDFKRNHGNVMTS
jgi:hypothetical protein